jgi:Flp pilus assembly protein TadB
VSDEDWIAERRRQLDDLIAESEAESAPRRQKTGHWYTDLLALVILFVVSWLLISSALTLAHFTAASVTRAPRCRTGSG